MVPWGSASKALLLVLVSVLILAAGVLAAPVTAGAQAAEPSETTTSTVPAPVVDRRVLAAGRDLVAAERERLAARRAVDGAERQIADLDGRIARVDADLGPARAERDLVVERLRGRAGEVYRRRSAGLGAALSLDGPATLAAGAHYADALAVVDGAALGRLQPVVDDLEARRAALDAERRDVVEQRDSASARLVDAEGVVVTVGARLAALGGTGVMGASEVDAATLAAWFRSTGHVASLAGATTVEDLAVRFVDEGAAEGVRGDLAFAQAIVETGWFAHATDNNYSGIGACDSCDGREVGFPNPAAGVRAQIQLLRSYADPDSRASDLASPPEPTLFGATPADAVRGFDRAVAKGVAPVWDAMGGGRWATDPTYAAKVLDVFAQIRVFRRA